MIKICIVVGGHLIPTVVDDPLVKHDSCLLIEDEKQKYRVCLGLERNEKLSKRYEPYWNRTLSLEKIIYLRDHLTQLIDAIAEDI